MPNENKFKYNIIIPVHNEEKYISNCLNSIVNQTHLPQEVIVVNDNSTDDSEKIIQEFAQNYSFIKSINSENHSTDHLPGSKIVNAFYKGFEHLKNEWDVIVKLDADVILPSNYFEEILAAFESDPKIGIAGGLAFVEQNRKWVYEKIGNKKQVRGPFKSYSKDCFEKIGGLKKSIGWDTVDELLAKYHGFEVKVLPELEVKLQKPTGLNYQKIHLQKMGESFYKMDYGFIISFIAAAKSSWKSKKPLNLFSILKSYNKHLLSSDNKIVTKEEGKFIRKHRWNGILNALTNRSQ